MGWGDELMVTGQVRELQRADPRKVRIEYERARWSEVFDHNPRIARPEERGDFQVLRPRTNGLRPYCAAKSEVRWTWKAYRPPVGELYFSRDERRYAEQFAGAVVIEPTLKRKASPNKAWGWVRWQDLALLMVQAGLGPPLHLGPRDTPRLGYARFGEMPSFRHACAVLALARAAVLPEGGLHHAAAALGVPTVVIYGGYISPEVTGYDTQVNLFAKTDEHPLGCGWRTPCTHCDAAMASITPARVFDELRRLLETDPGRLAA